MSEPEDRAQEISDADLEREVREGRQFTLEEAIARLAGPGMLKGESPVGRLQQAEFEIESWLRTHVLDAGGTLVAVMHRRIKGSELLLNNFEQPLIVLASYCKDLLASDCQLDAVVREADVEWSRVMGERPYLQMPGAPQHPNDPYTADSVRRSISQILQQLEVASTA